MSCNAEVACEHNADRAACVMMAATVNDGSDRSNGKLQRPPHPPHPQPPPGRPEYSQLLFYFGRFLTFVWFVTFRFRQWVTHIVCPNWTDEKVYRHCFAKHPTKSWNMWNFSWETGELKRSFKIPIIVFIREAITIHSKVYSGVFTITLW